MCEYCEGVPSTLIESEKIGNLIWWSVDSVLKRSDIDEVDNSLVLEVRNGQGYLRLGDRYEMSCLDHSENFEINYCPMCGRSLNDEL